MAPNVRLGPERYWGNSELAGSLLSLYFFLFTHFIEGLFLAVALTVIMSIRLFGEINRYGIKPLYFV